MRLIVAIPLSILPPLAMLVAVGVAGRLSWPWVGAAAGLSLLGGAMALAVAARTTARWAESLEAVVKALESRAMPAYVVAGGAMRGAQRRLLAVAESLMTELGSLTEQRDELEAILRSMREGVVVTRAGGELVLLNGAAREMFALSPDADYRGRNFVELCRDPRLQEFVTRSTAATDSEVIATELALVNPKPGHLRVNAAPLRAAKGNRAARVLVFSDISDLKAYESVRADFVANLTHEIRTPLSALCGYAETLVRGVEEPELQRRFLGIIERQSRRLARLIDDMLSLSDLEHGLTSLKFEPLEPRRLLEEAAELMREPAEKQGLALTVDAPAELPWLKGDHDRLQQLVLNLLDNAIKYTPRGGHVTASARAAAEGGQTPAGVELAVTDTGEGIPAVHIPRLTERFYRVDRARSRELGGTGLGLAIVKHIVQLHHGRLKIESRLREGTTVRILIPCGQAAVADDAALGARAR